MKIVKIINNNVVYARDGKNEHMVVTGKGIGFAGRHGDEIPADKIDSVIRMDNQTSMNRFVAQLEEIPEEHFAVSIEIVKYASAHLGVDLNKNVFITLTDHISFSIERYKKGLILPNPLLWEIQKYYAKEMQVGVYATKLIKERFNVEFGDDEAAFIAMHIVCARYNSEIGSIVDAAKLIEKVTDIIEKQFDTKLDITSHRFERFATHLRFLANRIIDGTKWDSGSASDKEFNRMVQTAYAQEYRCAKKIAEYIVECFSHTMSEMELVYITVHIRNMLSGDNRQS